MKYDYCQDLLSTALPPLNDVLADTMTLATVSFYNLIEQIWKIQYYILIKAFSPPDDS